jgi:hypothetical protein
MVIVLTRCGVKRGSNYQPEVLEAEDLRSDVANLMRRGAALYDGHYH